MYIGILEYNHDIISYMCILYHCMFVVGHDLVEPQARKAGYGTSACETKIVLSGINFHYEHGQARDRKALPVLYAGDC